MFRYLFAFLLLFLVPTFVVGAAAKVGILGTDVLVYEHEDVWLDKFYKLPEQLQLDFEIVMIDYNLIYSKYLKQKKRVSLAKLVENELAAKGIKHMILPGDYYNVHMPPLHPVKNKLDVYDALIGLVKESKVSIFAICGGMQLLLHTDGVNISNLVKVGITEPHSKYGVTELTPVLKELPGMVLTKIMVNPVSKIGRIIAKVPLEVTANGWLIMYLPDYHLEGVAPDKDNLKALRKAGYEIVGFSEDGVVEVVEDKYGNFYFQSHPENFLLRLTAEEMQALPEKIRNSAEAVRKLFIHFLES